MLEKRQDSGDSLKIAEEILVAFSVRPKPEDGRQDAERRGKLGQWLAVEFRDAPDVEPAGVWILQERRRGLDQGVGIEIAGTLRLSFSVTLPVEYVFAFPALVMRER